MFDNFESITLKLGFFLEYLLIIVDFVSLPAGTKLYKLQFNSTPPKSASENASPDGKDEKNCDIHYVTGQRGSRKIVCGGFSYICAKVNGDRKYWVCAKQRSRNCKARLITNGNETMFIRRNQSHNHHSEHSIEHGQNDWFSKINFYTIKSICFLYFCHKAVLRFFLFKIKQHIFWIWFLYVFSDGIFIPGTFFCYTILIHLSFIPSNRDQFIL